MFEVDIVSMLNSNYYGKFFIKRGITSNADSDIAAYLGLGLKEYQEILIKCGADFSINGECYFENREDVEITIKELEPYEVIAKIME